MKTTTATTPLPQRGAASPRSTKPLRPILAVHLILLLVLCGCITAVALVLSYVGVSW